MGKEEINWKEEIENNPENVEYSWPSKKGTWCPVLDEDFVGGAGLMFRFKPSIVIKYGKDTQFKTMQIDIPIERFNSLNWKEDLLYFAEAMAKDIVSGIADAMLNKKE